MNKGSIASGSFFMFRYLPQKEPQYAFVASKKIAKKATQRNSLRRKGYNILRQFNIKSHSGIFFFKKEGLDVKTPDLKKDIENILIKSRIL